MSATTPLPAGARFGSPAAGFAEQDTIIQTRSASVVEWLQKQGIRGIVKQYVRPQDVEGKWLIASTAPVWVLAAAKLVSYVDFPPGQIEERTVSELDALGARLITGIFVSY